MRLSCDRKTCEARRYIRSAIQRRDRRSLTFLLDCDRYGLARVLDMREGNEKEFMKKISLFAIAFLANSYIGLNMAHSDGSESETDGSYSYWDCGSGITINVEAIKEPKTWLTGFYMSQSNPILATNDLQGEVEVSFKLKWDWYSDKIWLDGRECSHIIVRASEEKQRDDNVPR
jgi:hypothetical protein